MVICLNMRSGCCRGLLIYGTMANKTAFSVSACVEYFMAPSTGARYPGRKDMKKEKKMAI